MQDVSNKFQWNPYDAKIGREMIKREGTPEAITYFNENCKGLTDYGYWFYLSTLWVSYTGYSDLDLWKELFSSLRPNRKQCIMKPSELRVYEAMPKFVHIYRAHRDGETDWIAYTTNPIKAGQFARLRGVSTVKEYEVKKKDIIALFLRRGEDEVIVLDKKKVKFKTEIPVVEI
jgi:hypothetical protein